MSFWTGVRRRLRTPVARVGLGLFAFGTGAVALWPPPTSVFAPEKALAFTAAISAWLFAELFPESENSNEPRKILDSHDIEFGERLRAVTTDDFLTFLDEHDFGGSFRGDQSKPIYELTYLLSRTSSAFNDADLQEALEAMKKVADEFAQMVAYGSSPKNGRETIFTMIPENEPDGLWSKETVAKVMAANQKADDLSAAIKSVLSLLRSKGFVLRPTSYTESGDSI